LGTRPLFPPPATSYAPFPDRDEPRNGSSFDHGSRIRRRELSIVFDAIGSAEGLVGVLNVLKDYGVTATFFVNGEFIRQSPGAARLLAGSGNEIGSMFFTAVDPTDSRFRIDIEYVRRGLARAEDEWFAATGKELSLLWHTPYYTVNTDILAAGASMNYTYIGRDVDPLDWVTRADATSLPGSYLDSHRIVEKVVAEAKPGSIIPIRLGIADGGRDDYLFRELALLIDDLIDSGYQIVPVSTLIEHSN
jgi:peptidoglycan/xylan/chitin deacetylase (PgdA/CDA1 family)